MTTTAIQPLQGRALDNTLKLCDRLVSQVNVALSDLFQHRNDDGAIFTPTIADSVLAMPYHIIVIDPNKLWHFDTGKLAHQCTLDRLSIACGKPVKAITKLADGRTGLAYIVTLQDNLPPVDLPKLTELPADTPPGDYSVFFGASASGPVWRELGQLTHIVVAGSSDSGKSVFLRSLVYQLARMSNPVELYLADLEGLTFSWAENLPIVKAPIAQTVEAVQQIGETLLAELERRADLYTATGRYPENLDEYHAAISNLQSPISNLQPPTSNLQLSRIIFIIDEFTALVEAAGPHSYLVQNILAQLAQRSRKFGVTLVLAGQDFKSDLFPTRITNQLKTRVAFRCATSSQSRNIIGRGGAERITIPGRAIALLDGRHIEIQTPWLDKQSLIPNTQSLIHNPQLSQSEISLFTEGAANGNIITAEMIQRHLSLSETKAYQRARDYQRRGWLTAPGGGGRKSRAITNKLLAILKACHPEQSQESISADKI